MSLAGAVCLLQFLVTVHFLSTNKITAVKLARYRIRQCIKELIVIKKINTTTNFNTGAITETPKRQFLAQKHFIRRTYR